MEWYVYFCQPRSQAVSFLPPFVVGRKTLVALVMYCHMSHKHFGNISLEPCAGGF